jgi:hypothetical protein
MKRAHFVEEPREQAYRRLIATLLTSSREFLLVVRGDMKLQPAGRLVLEQLASLEMRCETGREWPGGGIGGRKHTAALHYFRSTPDALGVLGECVDGLYGWRQPDRPEDLSFWGPQSNVLLGVIAHEHMAWVEGTAEWVEQIRGAVGSRFLGPGGTMSGPDAG